MIKVGDLVVVVRANCPHDLPDIGKIFTVTAIRFSPTTCRDCGHHNPRQWHVVDPTDPGSGYPFPRLKRIPPLPELESRGVDEQAKVG